LGIKTKHHKHILYVHREYVYDVLYIENMFMMFCFDSQMLLLLIWYLICIHTTNIRKKYFYFKLRFPRRLTLVLFLNLDAADFIFTWNLAIGELMTICVVNTSHMISLSHKCSVWIDSTWCLKKFSKMCRQEKLWL